MKDQETSIQSLDVTKENLEYGISTKIEGVLTNIQFLGGWLDTPCILAFSETCQMALRITANVRKHLILKRLLFAVVRGNEDLARKIFMYLPELLLDPSATATDISGKEIKNLTPLQAAICAGDVDMVQMIKNILLQKQQSGVVLSFDPEQEIQRQLAVIYTNRDLDAVEKLQKLQAHEFKSSSLRAVYDSINAASVEQIKFELDTPGQHTDSQLNAVLHNFRAQFAATSNQEQIFNPFYLLSAFEFYVEKVDHFNLPDGKNLFWQQIIGYIQRHSPACYLQAFAQGAYYIVEMNEKLKRDFKFRRSANSFILNGLSIDGMGYKWAVHDARPCSGWLGGGSREDKSDWLEELLLIKQSAMKKLKSPPACRFGAC